MRFFMQILVIAALLLGLSGETFSQGEAAVPFLLLTSSPETNGMGGLSSAVVSMHPMAPLGNAGQIGQFALSNVFNGGIYAPSTTYFLSGFNLPDLSYTTWAVNAGVNLQDLIDAPIPLGIGVGYARVGFDLGTFAITGPSGPAVIGTFSAYEVCDNILFGVGADYWVKLGLGMNYRIINSHLSPIGTEAEQGGGSGHATAHDFGLLLQVPVTGIATRAGADLALLPAKIEPLLDLTFGYTKRVIGTDISYVDAAQADPLPRNAVLGAGFEVGFESKIIPQGWKLVSLTMAQEAEDLLVTRSADGSWSYVSGSGSINFWDNVIMGHSSAEITLRKGWQIDCAEIFSIRGGSVEAGLQSYSTEGYGIQLSGVAKAILALGGDIDDSWLGYLLKNLDIRYDHAQYTREGQSETYGAISLALHTLPF